MSATGQAGTPGRVGLPALVVAIALAVAFTLMLALVFIPPAVLAANWEAHARIREAASAAVGGRVPAGDVLVAPELRLAACAQPLQAVAAGPRNVEVRCPDSPGWRTFVPLRLRDEAAVVVLARAARAGQPLQADQLALQPRDVATVSGTPFADARDAVGRIPRRGLPPGAVLTEQLLAREVVLRRGDPVMLVSRQQGIEVRAPGRVLGNAAAGATVAVENLASRRIIKGRANADGEVEVLR